MKFQNIIYSLIFASFVFIGCKNEDKKEITTDAKEIVSANTKELAINISGMTCEIGCAKYIQSKLSKEEGVIDANVVFTDSLATVKYDASKTNKASLISLVNGLADNMYTATEGKSCAGKKTSCSETKKDCCKGEKEACAKDKKTSCSGTKKGCCKEKKACTADAKKDCCKGEKKACATDKSCAASCEKEGCKTKEAKACASTCEKACCDTKEGKSCATSAEDKKSCATNCVKSCCA